ncbi:dicarboxylate/amino acid:cation symporter [Marinibactrum halimedae]|uniref:Proton/glutamate symporter n=1 Tax=Marinibactrum halimedae TaxID=1444977 RepID=A0AA37TBA5_9GAMM|nr:dicarboxylate/amino acid:cation symporter [Marinibactrum halimedae]MCD9459955.1 dicarboxylate/amino acid:cation symporter [Marinibactrum halimedae]GLS28277.1 proton/glutamate symporter [Marinibactrum halimedae]
MSLTTRILIAMATGISLGVLLNSAMEYQWLPASFEQVLNTFIIDGAFDVVGQIFVKSLKLLVVPLVFISLVCGCASLGGNSRLGPIAGRTLLLYMFTTAAAISLALLAGTLVQPGAGIGLAEMGSFAPKEAPAFKEVLINIFPSNPIQAMAEANMLQVIVFSVLTGLALSKMQGESGKTLRNWFESMNELVMKMVTMLMNLAPYGVFCLLAGLFAELGIEAIAKLIKYFLTVVVVLMLHAFGVYTALFKFFTGLSPLMLIQKMRSTLAFAFSTSSSSATLPVTLNTVENRLGVHNRVASFTIPLGATINMDGTAIMQGVATAFIAQAYGVDIGFSGYLMVVLTATMASVGTAGVPGVGLVTLAMVLQQVNLPVEGVALIIGVDRLLDMIRTAVNITGDSVVSTIVAKKEGALDEAIFNDPNAGLAELENEEESEAALQTAKP